ncbi:hypothetical protein B566_EDAN007670 [Ephemera danica]|nr:hypothetical protein B566_EDAN007670 [Ephemera danica]
MTDAEKKAKEVEDKLKKTEKILSGKKEKLTKAEKDLEAEHEKLRQSEGMQKEVAVGWLRERDELKASVTEMTRRAEQLEEQLAGRAREVEALEGSLSSERAMVAELKKTSESTVAATSAAVEKQLAAAREELSAAKSRATDLAAQLEKAEKAKRAADEKARKDIADLQTRLSENEIGRTTEKQKLELQIKEKEQEIRSLGNQLKAAQQEAGSKKVAEIQEECNQKIKKLENDLSSERQEYEELTARYELLEEEHVVTKAQLTMDRDKAETALTITQQELATLDGELQTLRETYNSKQDTWIKEKLDMQEQLKELEEKVSRGGGESWHLEKNRLKAQIEEKVSDMEKTKHELDVLSDQLNYTRKESEELRRKLEDFDKVSKVQRNMTADTNALTKELKELRGKLLLEEKNHKTEVAQLKMRYDSRVALISEEMQSLQSQVAKFKRERDSHRHMLEAAQKTIETRTKIATLEQQLGCMEDELSDARLEASKLKTELVSERSAWEVKLSEMQSHLNELEEDRLISTGRTKIPGMRTRMELAWQKEREEQHRLLQETSTLARDLRQTLFEVERERDKERLEGKRKLDQLKKNMEEEMEENRKKITEMQYDLLELRDAHAKLRTTNEKLRRERERWDKERDEQRQLATFRKRQELDEERKINSLLEQVEELMRLAPDLFPEKHTGSATNLSLPVPPKRTKGPRSRESSPGMERKDYSREPSVGAEDRKQQMHSTLVRLTEATNELRKYQRLGEEEKDRERARRTLGFRRAASTEAEPPPSEGQNKLRSQKANGSSNKKGSLFRKSLSLEQTSGGMSQDQTIWTGEDGGSMNSLQSLESEDARFLNMQRRDPSVDR